MPWTVQEFPSVPRLVVQPRNSSHMGCFVNVIPICKLVLVRRCFHKPILNVPTLRPSSRLCKPSRLFLVCSSGRLDLFYHWLTRENVYMPKIKLDQNKDGLRGVVAVEGIECDESFLKVPRDLSLQVTEHEECTMSEFVDPELWSQENWYVKLSLKLLKEKYLGKLSLWKPYIDILPHALNTGLVYWSSSELAQLQYRPLIEEVKINQYYREALYTRVFESLSSPVRVWLQNEKENVFFWALDMVQSRAFGIPDVGNKTYALLPMMDMLNHRVNSQTHFLYDSIANQYEMKTYSKLSPGTDIYISYGPLDNDHLLHFYGKLILSYVFFTFIS
ncbi:ribulose-1,5 bisphosphate carboxylase oxygenase large subunit N-methyltransferase, putative isoform 2 [Galdieria sulphuraria]|uniref:Ribulose-1,5 bisphosphate carboxylase oxygenase large subunit N-methyltransferase, putative isoform 2 n=1 Tax=Galdieria sulphuraria TaxID=130081 RepID=M2X853_GALSU|nr:ribulose-1,5 bisphosphate carboxylase oxygenase large subunit N-methyltransferase, putative isoform 2 [Galdieria sulphuraria]EME32740.1 ribulose-1,5 bisphosphate carboxylase oxygenase large subunit N-methyltransferase, putative isoform 2 [Galdieria sulphuraria]|eukprot:XP_005709260.1 ribulose-1,5 bisphosphate carboxylase oxygenase large subunit N-methyltransferase, putative isoform 2 [Galdieria sulphuraria]